jgi:hypothetical protein
MVSSSATMRATSRRNPVGLVVSNGGNVGFPQMRTWLLQWLDQLCAKRRLEQMQ